MGANLKHCLQTDDGLDDRYGNGLLVTRGIASALQNLYRPIVGKVGNDGLKPLASQLPERGLGIGTQLDVNIEVPHDASQDTDNFLVRAQQ